MIRFKANELIMIKRDNHTIFVKVSNALEDIEILNLHGRGSKYTKQKQIYKMERSQCLWDILICLSQ